MRILFCIFLFWASDGIAAKRCKPVIKYAGAPATLARILEEESLPVRRELINKWTAQLLEDENLSPEDRKKTLRWSLENGIYIPDFLMDAVLGLNVAKVCGETEKSLYRFKGEIVWNSLQSMAQTPYDDFHREFSKLNLKKGDLVVDIGTGFGRLGFYLSIFHPGVRFIGYELVPERTEESKRAAKFLGLGEEIQFINQDLAAEGFELPAADVYYSWNPVAEKTGQKIWEQMRKIAQSKSFVWVFRGLSGSQPHYHEEWLEVDSNHHLRPRIPVIDRNL